jgi:hypothetical protein
MCIQREPIRLVHTFQGGIMNYPKTYSSKTDILEFLRRQPKEDLIDIATLVNEDPINQSEVPESGSRDELIRGLNRTTKGVLKAALEDYYEGYDFDEGGEDEDEDDSDEAVDEKDSD